MIINLMITGMPNSCGPFETVLKTLNISKKKRIVKSGDEIIYYDKDKKTYLPIQNTTQFDKYLNKELLTISYKVFVDEYIRKRHEILLPLKSAFYLFW